MLLKKTFILKRRLYNDEATADMELHCGSLVIKAHRYM
jgi:hypothetical protein